MNIQQKIEKRRAYDREWKRQYKLKNPDKVKEKRRERYHREKKNPEWLKNHKEYMRAYQAKWGKDNPKRLLYRREWMRNWQNKNAKSIYKRRMSKPHERIAASLRSRIYAALKSKNKSAKTEILLGATIPEVKKYLELQFQEGMDWDNYGFYSWHIDHIKPLAMFDLTDPQEQKQAFHYTNLQPLWAEENLRKHKKYLN